ncbi:MAG TPA: hypothetical protein VFE62_03390 [Gemmataceae bacterium]|nr:hypothetical protein [Gemmataceae bacterium]
MPLWWDAGTLADLGAWLAERRDQGCGDADPFVCSVQSHRAGVVIHVGDHHSRTGGQSMLSFPFPDMQVRGEGAVKPLTDGDLAEMRLRAEAVQDEQIRTDLLRLLTAVWACSDPRHRGEPTG